MMTEVGETESIVGDTPVPVSLKKAKRTSDVWQYFKKISRTQSLCLVCHKVCSTSGNTTNLRDHLKRKHRDLIFQNNDCLEIQMTTDEPNSGNSNASTTYLICSPRPRPTVHTLSSEMASIGTSGKSQFHVEEDGFDLEEEERELRVQVQKRKLQAIEEEHEANMEILALKKKYWERILQKEPVIYVNDVTS